MASVDLIKDGLGRQVGDEHSIKIWQDIWLLSLSTHRIQSSVSSLPPNSMVHSLIDSSTGQWNNNLLHQIFIPSKVEQIRQIPISIYGASNKPIWWYTKDGHYIVRSPCYMEISQIKKPLGSTSQSNSTNPRWKSIWSLRVSNSVWHFIWRACYEILPI